MVITDRPAGTGRSNTLPGLLAGVGALAFIVSAAWYGLAVKGVTVAPEPSFTRGQPLGDRNRIYLDWFVSTLSQERLYTGLAIVGFCCLTGAAVVMRGRLGLPAGSAVAVGALGAGSGLWVVGNVVQLGGHRAVGLMAAHGSPLPTVTSLHLTVDLVDDAFELTAFALLGSGMLLFGWFAVEATSLATWGRYTLAVGLLLVATSVSYALDNGRLTDLLLMAAGVALPIWLLWLARISKQVRSHGHRDTATAPSSDAARPVAP